jgi:hypothetical protein
MPAVKTAISLPEPLFHRAETVAHELQISRSQLVATAVDECWRARVDPAGRRVLVRFREACRIWTWVSPSLHGGSE